MPEVDKSTCWYSQEVIDEMNKFYDLNKNNADVREHFKAFNACLNHSNVKKLSLENTLLDLGCGTAALSEFCKEFSYVGADLPHVIAGCAMRNFPEFLYKACDIYENDLSFIAHYDVVVMNGMLDVMQHPKDVLKKVLEAMSFGGFLIIHRQEITEKGESHTKINGSYNSTTYHSVINREEFLNILAAHDAEIMHEETCGFANWENGGSSFLIYK